MISLAVALATLEVVVLPRCKHFPQAWEAPQGQPQFNRKLSLRTENASPGQRRLQLISMAARPLLSLKRLMRVTAADRNRLINLLTVKIIRNLPILRAS